MTSLIELVAWFTDLREQGVKREDVFDAIEFDSDQDPPDHSLLLQARDIVWPTYEGGPHE